MFIGTNQQETFKRNAHINYFLRCLRALPTAAEGHDSNRITIAYFCLSGLDLLGVLQDKTTSEQRNGWIEWIWSLQSSDGGFRGSTHMTTDNPHTSPGHLPSTYTALLCLAILRAPLERLNLPALVSFLKSCQSPDGSFSPLPDETTGNRESSFQSDLRMVYIACVICDMIRDFSIDVEATKGFVGRCKTWEGGYASRPGVIEAQGGTTYCAMAALHILSAADANSVKTAEVPDGSTLRWLVNRQIGGFQGRPGKLEDVCYSFWCGAALSIVGRSNLIDTDADKSFLLSSQSPMGGFGKEPEDYPDPYHSYLAIAALSLSVTRSGRQESNTDGSLLGEKLADSDSKSGTDIPALTLARLDPLWNISVEVKEGLMLELNRQLSPTR